MERSVPRYLTSLEVASACGVSTRTVSNWIRDGAIPAHRTVGGHGRVAVDDLRRFLSDRGVPIPARLADGTLGAPAQPVPDPPGAGLRPLPPPGDELAALARRRRVLIIDDDEALLEILSDFLGGSGYEVETARHGFLAGYLAGHHRPDVVILDIMMPGVDGYEVLALMRRRPEARAIPVIACTALRGTEPEERMRAAGFDAYLRKPIDFKVLLQLLEKLVR